MDLSKEICPICGKQNISTSNYFNYILYHCFDCHLRWKNIKYPASVYDARYYQQRHSWLDNKLVAFNFKMRNRSILKYTNPGNILDFGAGTGKFLTELKKYGYKNLFATEISLVAKKILVQKKIVLINISELTKNKFKKKFQLITLLHVLEHVSNPNTILKILKMNLTDHGLLAVEVPNSWSINARIFGTKHLSFDDQTHLFYFSRKSLKLLLRNTGFRIIKENTVIGTFPLAYFSAIQKIRKQKKGGLWFLYSLLYILLLPLTLIPHKNNQEIIRIYARKN